MVDDLVVDASAMVDLLLDGQRAPGVAARLRDRRAHAPAHVDAEVLSAIGRMHRAGAVSPDTAEPCIRRLSSTPIARHTLPSLVIGTWRRRGRLRLVDALYVELAERLDAPLITTDARLASVVDRAELVS